MKKLLFFCVISFLSLSTIGANYILDGDFENKLGRNLWGSSFGAGPGSSGRSQEHPYKGNWCYKIFKERGPGGAQLMGRIPIEGVETFEFSFYYKGSGTVAFSLAYQEGKKDIALLSGAGKPYRFYCALPHSEEWKKWSRKMTLPLNYRKKGLLFRPQFQVFAGNTPKTFWLDELSLEVAQEDVKVEKPKTSVRVEMPEKVLAYGPIDVKDPFRVEYKDGIMRRDGAPYYWVGNGCDLGSAQATPIGLWLAKVQGVSFIALESGMALRIKEESATNAVITAKSVYQQISWYREAARLGFLTEAPITAGNFRWSPLKKYSQEHPDFAEHYYYLGHGLSADTGSGLGREIMLANRLSYLQYMNEDANFICELGREPGAYPSNTRIKEAFRGWCKIKYGTLGKASEVWRKDFKSWEDVVPAHLDKDDLSVGVSDVALRKYAKEKTPEFYLDWMRFLQEDVAQCMDNEISDLRSAGVKVPVSCDIRGHRHYQDGYAAYEPSLILDKLDIFFLHYGHYSYFYNNTPWHLKTLLSQTTFPLMMCNYFRTNVKTPLVDCEDIVSVVRLPGSNEESMAKNCLGSLHGEWKISFDDRDEGVKGKWFAPDFDDSAWGDVMVPGCWDEQDAHKGKSGIAWYRKTFVSKANRQDYLDGSRKFYIYGRGVAQSGTLWLNGKKVGEVKGWNTPYRFEVSEMLRYGRDEKNTIVWRIDGRGFQNGLRRYCHLLAQDMINEARPFGEAQYRSLLWTFMMRGLSGQLVWNWFADSSRLYMPDIIKPLEVAAKIALDDVRFKKSKVAYLYSYLNGYGLPCPSDESHEAEMNWYAALEFTSGRPDLVSEETFQDNVTAQTHSLLVVPYCRFVQEKTWKAFRKYVENGGTAVITKGSFEKTFDKWEDCRFEEWAQTASSDGRIGKGRLIVAEKGMVMPEIISLLKPFLPANEVEIKKVSPNEEEPMIERMLAGKNEKRILYLHNWGGMRQTLEVKIPSRYDGWMLTPLTGDIKRDGNGKIIAVLEEQSPTVAMLQRDREFVSTKINQRHREIVNRLKALYADKNTGSPKVLWPKFSSPHYTAGGRELFPYILEQIESMGYEHAEKPFEEWTDEELSKYKMIVLPEGNSAIWKGMQKDAAFQEKLKRYVERGGSLFVLAVTSRTTNSGAGVLKHISKLFGVTGTWNLACDSKNATFGDPMQITADVVDGDELTEGVEKVSLYVLAPLSIRKGSGMKGIVNIPSTAESCANTPAMAYGRYGKGKVFVSADAMAFQPFRIEHADNAALLVNIMGWLLDRTVTQPMRDSFKSNLFLKESDLKSLTIR